MSERYYICRWQWPDAVDAQVRAPGAREAARRFVNLWRTASGDDRGLLGEKIVVTETETGNQSEWCVALLDVGAPRVTEAGKGEDMAADPSRKKRRLFINCEDGEPSSYCGELVTFAEARQSSEAEGRLCSLTEAICSYLDEHLEDLATGRVDTVEVHLKAIAMTDGEVEELPDYP